MCNVEFVRRLEEVTTVFDCSFSQKCFRFEKKTFTEPKAPFWRFEIFPRKQFDINGSIDVSVEGQNGFQVQWVILPVFFDTVK